MQDNHEFQQVVPSTFRFQLFKMPKCGAEQVFTLRNPKDPGKIHMYGVPADLPLNLFVDATLTLVGLGQYQTQLHFMPEGYIDIEGKWELKDALGNVTDENVAHESRECYRIHKIIGQDVINYEINPPLSFTLHFKNGYSLTIYDDSQEYESFSIQPGNIFV